MTGTTTNLGLKTYDTTTDGAELFYSYITDTSASSATSNVGLIDEFARKVEAKTDAIEVLIGDGVGDLTVGVTAYFEVPNNFTLQRVTLVANTSGCIVLDVWKDTYANFPPTVADTITASAKPTLTSAQKYQDTTLTGWTTSWAKGDWIAINIDSFETVKLVTVSFLGLMTLS